MRSLSPERAASWLSAAMSIAASHSDRHYGAVGSAGLATHRASASRHSGSPKPKVASKRFVASTPYAGRRAGVGYSAVEIGTTRGFFASPTIADAESCRLALTVADM